MTLSKNFFENYRFNKVIQVLLLTDIVIGAASSSLAIILPFFVTSRVAHGNIEVLGIGFMAFYFAQAFGNVVSGRLMDRYKGLFDEYYAFFYSMIIRGIGILLFIWVTQISEFYVLQIISGLTSGIIGTAWRAIFIKYTDKSKEATEWGVDLALLNLSAGVFAYIGAVLAEKIDLSFPFILGSIVTFLGALLLIIIKPVINKSFKPQ
jgi:MFS family permease